MKVTCPKCRREIPLDDVNVATDIALCRACQETFSFAELRQYAAAPNVDLSKPPKGMWYYSQGNEFEVGTTTRSWAALFLVPFTLVWSGISVGGIYGTQIKHGHFQLFESLFGIPFLLGSAVLISATLMCLLGKIALRGSGDQGSVFMGVGPLGWSWKFRWSDIKGVRISETKWQQNHQNLPLLELVAAKPVRFGSGLSEEKRNYVLAVIRRRLGNR